MPFQDELAKICILRKERFERDAYVLSYNFTTSVVTIRIVLNDEQSGAEIAITNMTTLPCSEMRKGYGTNALTKLIELALLFGIQRVVAVQVQDQSERFWVKNGFSNSKNSSNDFWYTKHRV